MELFVALDFEETALATLTSAGETLRRQVARKNILLEGRGDLHLTLRYLGMETSVEQVVPRLAQVRCPPFKLTLGGVGAFQNRDETVLWAGVGGAVDKLRELKDRIDQRLTELPLSAELLPFSPHITLATLPPWSRETERVAESCPVEPTGFTVRAFHLYHICGKKGEPRFNKLYTFSLAEEEHDG